MFRLNRKKEQKLEKKIWEDFSRGKLETQEAISSLQKIILKEKGNTETDFDLETILAELESLVGLQKVKEVIKEIQAYINIQKQRSLLGLQTNFLSLHMIFKGNPGTGKTTVARLLGKLFFSLGILPKGDLIEAERADLVGEYIGHTAQKTKRIIQKAQGGVLFVDEAYSLARGGEKDFGKEAIDTLVKAMEDYRDQFILIFAGYRREMERFLLLNPGLDSRFPIKIDFPDYSIPDLLAIAELMVRQREYELTAGAKYYLEKYLKDKARQHYLHFSNARLVRNIIEKALRRQALRLMSVKEPCREELMRITKDDLIAVREDDLLSLAEEGSYYV
ncbi:MAG: AAA family ATPase [Dethiobacteria bacterium]|jgi:stage V sporulation protein K|nr:AAA family ATPase [Bacillota bacterium]